jgi:hypothetical protein
MNKLPNQFYYYLFGIFLYSSLIVGFIFSENLTGGAQNDYLAHKEISLKFSISFLETLLNFDKESTRHSPILLIIFSFFEKIGLSDPTIRLINLHFLLLIIFFFFKCLKIKFRNYDNKILYLISFLLFLSPTFRSLSIWPDSRLHGLLYFIISIYFFLNFKNENNKIIKFRFALLNIFFLSLASYFSLNFCLFVFFFLFHYFNAYKVSKSFLIIILINIFLSLPAIYYVFFLKIFFFLTPVSEYGKSFIALNPSNKIILISSIFLFHYFPIFFVTKNKYTIQIKYLIILTSIFAILIYFFNYQTNFTGGGIIYKLSNILFNNNYFVYFLSFLGFLLIFNLSYKSLNNFLIIFMIILSNPQLEIYHKYYDPILLIFFFTLFNFNFNRLMLKKRIMIFYIYNLFFLIANFLR